MNYLLTDYWSFIEAYYPNYYSCKAILLSDILCRKLEGQAIDTNDDELIAGWDIHKEVLELNSTIMAKAIEKYFALQYADKNIL